MTQIFSSWLGKSWWRPYIFQSDDFNFDTRALGSVASLLAATFYADRNLKVRNIVSTEIYTPYADANGILLHINGKFTMGKLNCNFFFHMQGAWYFLYIMHVLVHLLLEKLGPISIPRIHTKCKCIPQRYKVDQKTYLLNNYFCLILNNQGWHVIFWYNNY
jgi:hypothetical protein